MVSTLPIVQLLQKCNIKYPVDIFTCNKVLVFNLGFDAKGKDTLNSWIYIPEKEYIFYRVGYYDNIMNTEKMSLYVEIGFPENQKLKDDKYYLDQVITDLKKIGIITTQNLVDYEAILMDPAYVHIRKESMEEMIKIKSMLAKYDISSIGRYGSWTYCSIEDNIIEAKELAEKLNDSSN